MTIIVLKTPTGFTDRQPRKSSRIIHIYNSTNTPCFTRAFYYLGDKDDFLMNPTLTSWPSEHMASPQAGPAPIRILLVEDDEDDHILIRDTFEEMGAPTCFLEWARTYEAGLQLIHEHRHDLYVFDYRLGAHTGIDLLRAGKASDPYITILLLTGSGGELVAAEALRLGAADYMPKNLLSTKSLHRAIMNTLEKAHLRRALAEHQQHVEHTNQILTKQNQEIQRFYHTLAHELKTPLTAAREFTAIMLDGLGGPLTSEQKEYLHLSQDCLDQITNQVNDLLDITRLDTGKLSIHQQPEDLSLLISRVVAAMKATAQHKSLTISVSCQLDTPTVWIDQSRITQVLTNLLSNAIKFTPPGGTITVETSDNPEDPSSVCVYRSTTPDAGSHLNILSISSTVCIRLRKDMHALQEGWD